MSWANLLDIIADECGMEYARRVEQRARLELGGLRITISTRVRVTTEMVEQAAPGQPKKAAKKLGISPDTAYRRIREKLLIR